MITRLFGSTGVGPIFTLNTSNDAVLRKEVLLGFKN